jgi:hypothetical protein
MIRYFPQPRISAGRESDLYELVTYGLLTWPSYSEWMVPNSTSQPDPRRYRPLPNTYPDIDEFGTP